MWEVAAEKGNYLIPKLKSLAARYPQIYKDITGMGLLIGMHFQTPEIGYQVAGDRIGDAIYAPNKVERQKKVRVLRDEVEAAIKEQHPDVTDFEIEQVFEYIQKKAFRISIME